jgi:SOS-response transcriptional repressor LexA
MRDKDYEVYEFIAEFIKKHGYSPSTREIRDGTSLTSTSTVNHSRDMLVKERWIDFTPRTARSITLREERKEHE